MPDALNKNFVILSKILQIFSTTFKFIKIFVKKKNGKSDGKTEVNQISKPLLIEEMYFAGFEIKHKIKSNKKIALKLIKIFLLFFLKLFANENT